MKATTKRKLSSYKQDLTSLVKKMETVTADVKNTQGFQEKQWKQDMEKLRTNLVKHRNNL